MNHIDGPRKVRKDTKTAHVFARVRAFRGLSILSISAAIAVGSIVAFSLIGESETAPESSSHQSVAMLSNAASSADSPSLVHRHPNAPEPAELAHRAESPSAQSSRIFTQTDSRTEPAQTAQFADAIAAPQTTEPHNFSTQNPRPYFTLSNHAPTPIAAAPRSSIAAEKQRETKPSAKTPAIAGEPETPSPKPRTTEKEKLASEKPAQPNRVQNLKQVTALPPHSGDNLSTLNSQLSTKTWPKPFTPEEERIRQQMGVQAFINFQHELATGEKRDAE